MRSAPISILEPTRSPSPLVVDSPHSGADYPLDFSYACPLSYLRQTEDFAVDRLVAGASGAGATILSAQFPRSYIDVNRADDDIDPSVLASSWPTVLRPCPRTLLGLGLVRRLCRAGVPVYTGPLTVAVVAARIRDYYRPYHEKLAEIVDGRLLSFGVCYLLDMHSMPDSGVEAFRNRRPDFVLGDRQGESCDPAFTRKVYDILRDLGFSVVLNDPYKGMEIVRKFGRPMQGVHSLQIEINRRLYMDEGRVELNEGFLRLRESLTEFFVLLRKALPQDRFSADAAE